MSALGLRMGALGCLGLGLANLAWVDFVLLPDRLASAERASRLASAERASAPRPAHRPAQEELPPRTTEGSPAPEPARSGPAPEPARPGLAPEPARPGLAPELARSGPAPEPARSGLAPEPAEAPSAPRPPEGTAEADALAAARAEAPRREPQEREWQVRFRHGRADLGPRARAVLQEALRVACEGACRGRVALDGYADPSGPSRLNLWLSRRRARAVQTWLIERGFDAGAIELRAHGERGPAPGDADRPKSWAARRRVEIEWRAP